jgi:hypothetical protein
MNDVAVAGTRRDSPCWFGAQPIAGAGAEALARVDLGLALPEPVQVVLGVRDLERQQEEREREEQDPRHVADPVVEPGELLRPRDPLVEPPLRDERRHDQQAADRDREDGDERRNRQLVLIRRAHRLAEIVQLRVSDPVPEDVVEPEGDDREQEREPRLDDLHRACPADLELPRHERRLPETGRAHSHSIVAGGFEVMSSTTRFTAGTSFTIRDEIVSSRS